MGTNYYAIINKCKACKRKDKVHLGKSSYGWRFTFQYNRGKYYKNITEMKTWLKDKEIRDEYGERVSYTTFWKMVAVKQKEEYAYSLLHPSSTDFMIGKYSFSDNEFC